MKNDLVIMRFNEDLSWIKKIDQNKFNFHIYNTGNSDIDVEFTPLTNIGNESRAYLEYIVKKYHSLPEYIVFLQGNPLPHIHRVDQGKEEDLVLFLNNQNFSFDFFGMGYFANDDHLINQRINILKYLETKFNLTLYPLEYFTAGAQFVVNRKLILNKPLEMWKDLLFFTQNSLEVEEKSIIDHNQMPWTMERLWNSLLN